MKKLASSSVLISGLGGLGVEVAKNVILAGAKSVTVHDLRATEISDLASNFYLHESSIGQNRATASLPQLSTLNEYVSVSAKTEALTDAFLKNYNCVVLTDVLPESEIKRISHFCHANKIKFVLTETRGVFGYAFTDFGPEHIISDPNGEAPSRFLLSMITKANPATITIAVDELHELEIGDYVSFEEIEGMTELNGKTVKVTAILSRRQFQIDVDSTDFQPYAPLHRAGYGNQVKLPQKLSYRSLEDALKVGEAVPKSPEESIKNPTAFSTIFDFCAFGRDQQVVLTFLASQRVFEKTSSQTVSAADLITAAKAINAEVNLVESVDESLLSEFARESAAVISPTCALFGGIVGQEVIKAISGKFTPLNQFLGVGYIEALPPAPITYTIRSDRYDPYRIVFGDAQQEVMQGLRYFMVGAGALGCEQLKNWALMGVATLPGGQIWVTDMDQIERSNLNRQFLFRNSDIGKMKSDSAAAAVRAMNPAIRVIPQQNRLAAESTTIYNDDFYENLSGVCNALDNIPTRLYSDSLCVFYNRPLLESGTLGPKAHSQIVVPQLTESYGSMADPPERTIPMCTLHHFPSLIDHCCVWARDIFTGLFEQRPQSVNAWVKGEVNVADMRRNDPGTLAETLSAVREFVVVTPAKDFGDCVRWARLKFEELFNNKIRDLCAQFPIDAVTSDGLTFWGGSKRFPTPATYDPANPNHAAFVTAAAGLRAKNFGIKVEAGAAERAASVKVEPWGRPSATVKVNEKGEPVDGADVSIATLETDIADLSKYIGRPAFLAPEEFEKDNDANGHIDFVAAAANIRAVNYEIPAVDRMTIKKIAGKIIPAIATTTAMVCGLIALEMYKVHSVVPKPIEDFRFGVINLAVNMYALSEPGPARKFTCACNGAVFTAWDNWQVEGDLTLREFMKAIKDKYDVDLHMLSVGSMMLFASFQPDLNAPRMDRKITEILVTDFHKEPLVAGQKYLKFVGMCFADDDSDIEIPTLVLKVH
jgi:ubiquitin-activating enzyme E1